MYNVYYIYTHNIFKQAVKTPKTCNSYIRPMMWATRGCTECSGRRLGRPPSQRGLLLFHVNWLHFWKVDISMYIISKYIYILKYYTIQLFGLYSILYLYTDIYTNIYIYVYVYVLYDLYILLIISIYIHILIIYILFFISKFNIILYQSISYYCISSCSNVDSFLHWARSRRRLRRLWDGGQRRLLTGLPDTF